jgi:hypothetical protein
MMDKLKNMFKKKQTNTTELSHRDLMMKEKEAATKAKKPWVGVLDTQVNKDNIRNGFFELDWNNEFIEQLLDAGYAGESNEEIVDLWFKDLARNVLEDEGHDPNRGAGFINTKNLGDGKSEVK